MPSRPATRLQNGLTAPRSGRRRRERTPRFSFVHGWTKIHGDFRDDLHDLTSAPLWEIEDILHDVGQVLAVGGTGWQISPDATLRRESATF